MYDYSYDYGYAADSVTNTMESMVGFGTAMVGLGIAIFIFSAIISLISIISYAKIFKKAGKPWWASIIPIYNTIVMIQIAGLPIWYLVLFFIPIANIFAIFKINIEMAKKFGKSTGFGVGMTLLGVIFIPLLAFSDNIYGGTSANAVNENQQFDATNVINNNVDKQSEIQNNAVINEVPIAPLGVNQNNEQVNPSIENTPSASPEVVSEVFEPVAPIEPASIDVSNVAPTSVDNVSNVSPEVVPEVVIPVETLESAPIDAFNVSPTPVDNMPSASPEVVEPIMLSEDISSEIAKNSFEGVNKKHCKNCGSELPEIVSICPNCGTDNE